MEPPSEKEASSCRQGDWLPESTVSRTEQVTPRSSAHMSSSGSQNKGLGSPVPQGRIARAGTLSTLCPEDSQEGSGRGVALEATNREGRLRPGECALICA